MEPDDLKAAIVDRIFSTADRIPDIVSTTIAGSFSEGGDLAGISDIDTIVVVRHLDAASFSAMQQAFAEALEPLLTDEGYYLRINPTLGPLKFNDTRTAVLHLMVYTCESHRDHVINSPFTCLDWQRSTLWHGRQLSEVYPAFGLQPHHFISGRRSAKDYLSDLKAGVVSYRTLVFDDGDVCREAKRHQPMDNRDRCEFAYHVMRFLMQNVLKLVRRENRAEEGEQLLSAYFAEFPEGAERFAPFYRELARRKREGQFNPSVPNLVETTTAFVHAFEHQFREAFEQHAVRHVLFRHAETAWNRTRGDLTYFQGESDLPIENSGHEIPRELVEAIRSAAPQVAFVSPKQRTAQTLQLVGSAVSIPNRLRVDERLTEIRYGSCEGRTVSKARLEFPDLFEAWARGEDPRFPGGGENLGDVIGRVLEFAAQHLRTECPIVGCTHNVVLRCLLGHQLNVPISEWHRLRIPHLAPISLVASDRFGLFVDLDVVVERAVFSNMFRCESAS
ncbi:histidine phosphatase family protein [Rubinisphaera margarita]|uniref:histidine phosphatase family protein n=1 Tax=Rubinisphaera margarita TaxID=2909586 RepID=UPI001EE78503|nr:histidine phosphatase family protein [Rubinisphaera margarita]MCG6154651.1 histidine phosphatase family protein [Rubinisphaera margarita]